MHRTTLTADASLADQLPLMLPRLWTFALRVTGNPHKAEDLLKRACLTALEYSHAWRPGMPLLHWMFSIAYATWRNEMRTRSAPQHPCSDWDEAFMTTVICPSTGNSPEPFNTPLYSRITRAVAQLPETQRIVMLLVEIEGLGYEDAAVVLGVPVSAVMTDLCRARQTIGGQFIVKKPGEVSNNVHRRG
jgi:RNA polymerase sigma-70 factor, ECF subfamily